MNLISRMSMIVALSSSAVAFAGTHGAPNCDVGGKKIHTKNQAACEKKKGTFSAEKAVSAGKEEVKAVEQKLDQKLDQKTPDVKLDGAAPEVKK